MTRQVLAAALVTALCVACRAKPKPAPSRPMSDVQDTQPAATDLARELEATVLEGYSQLSLGNLEAYGDTVAEDLPVVLIKIGPDDVVIGNRDEIRASAFRIAPCVEILSKNLEVHLSRDSSVGWVFDDASCRVPDPYEGRRASIPLRVTGVYQRHVDSWVLVMQHVSYAWPTEDVLAWSRAGNARRVARIGQAAADAPADVERALREALARPPAERLPSIAARASALVLWPGPADEYHGEAIAQAPSLAQAFGPRSRVRPRGVYTGIARNGEVAWAAANLELEAHVSDDRVTLPLRATYVMQRVEGGWHVVQAHVSAPILAPQLSQRVFGN